MKERIHLDILMHQEELELSDFDKLCREVKVRILHKIAKAIHPSKARIFFHKMRGVEIGENTFIGTDVHLDDTAPELIKISDGVRLAAMTVVLVHKRDIGNYYKKGMEPDEIPFVNRAVVFEENVQVGVRAIILPGVTIGKGSIIGAGSVVTRDIPENALAVGNPAEVVRTFE